MRGILSSLCCAAFTLLSSRPQMTLSHLIKELHACIEVVGNGRLICRVHALARVRKARANGIVDEEKIKLQIPCLCAAKIMRE